MTYCGGIKTNQGVVLASDSRTNAGLDNVNIYSKMLTYDVGDRTIIVVTSGNLAPETYGIQLLKETLLSV